MSSNVLCGDEQLTRGLLNGMKAAFEKTPPFIQVRSRAASGKLGTHSCGYHTRQCTSWSSNIWRHGLGKTYRERRFKKREGMQTSKQIITTYQTKAFFITTCTFTFPSSVVALFLVKPHYPKAFASMWLPPSRIHVCSTTHPSSPTAMH